MYAKIFKISFPILEWTVPRFLHNSSTVTSTQIGNQIKNSNFYLTSRFLHTHSRRVYTKLPQALRVSAARMYASYPLLTHTLPQDVHETSTSVACICCENVRHVRPSYTHTPLGCTRNFHKRCVYLLRECTPRTPF